MYNSTSNDARLQFLNSAAPNPTLLHQYAMEKQLPITDLLQLKLADTLVHNRASIAIPYYGVDGTEKAMRYRHGNDGKSKFSWRKGDNPTLYNLQNLTYARENNVVYLVEGESDCHTLMHYKLPVLGLPGASTWDEDRDAEHFVDIDQIYLVYENDAGGKMLVKQLCTSVIAPKVKVLKLPFKDISAMHCASPTSFLPTLEQAKQSATTVQALQPQPQVTSLNVLCLDAVHAEPVKWLWPGRIALRKLTVLAGHPGLGKSQITCWLAALVSAGGNFPDGTACDAGGEVLMFSAEDDPGDTIKPRIIAAGGNSSLVYISQLVSKGQGDGSQSQRGFDLAKDVELLHQKLRELRNPKLVVIDPISAYMGNTDSNNNADVRGLLMPLSNLAADLNVAIVLVTHFNKSSVQEPLAKVIGSVATVAAARAAFAVVKDDANDAVRYFLPLKNNIGLDDTGFAYQIEPVTLSEGVQTAKVTWLPNMVAASPILYPNKSASPKSGSEVMLFLKSLLDDGPIAAADALAQGKTQGFSADQIKRARVNIGALTRKSAYVGGFEWYLKSSDKSRKDAPIHLLDAASQECEESEGCRGKAGQPIE